MNEGTKERTSDTMSLISFSFIREAAKTQRERKKEKGQKLSECGRVVVK